jgi:Cytochrome c
MRDLRLATVLISGGLLLFAGCGSSGSSVDAGSETGGHAGAGSGGKIGTGGTGGTAGTHGGTGGAVGATGGTGGVAGATSGTGGAVGATGGAGGAAGEHGGTGGATGGAGGAAGGHAGTGGVAGATGGAGGAAGGHAGAGGAAGATGGVGGAGGAAGATGGVGGAAGATGGVGGAAGAAGGAGGHAGTGGAAGGAGGMAQSAAAARGQYLVTDVLGCTGCHTPTGGALLSGTDCFIKSGTTGCLSSANLTNDPSGLMNLTDQQIKDAFTLGMEPGAPTKYLFSNMPYYQFTPLTSADVDAIVAYLRTVPGVSHTVQAATAPFDVRPTTPDWTAVNPANLPAGGTATGPANGKYLATLTCATCHTVNATGSPTHIDATKAFQGGKLVTATVNGTAKMVQTSNLTPDSTGLMNWDVSQVATAITAGKDNTGATICGMRALANMTASDAVDIGTYLLSIPAVANTITMTCQ